MRRRRSDEIKRPPREITRQERELGAMVDKVHHAKSGITIPIRLNKETMTFGAFVNNAVLTSKDGDRLKLDVLNAITTGLQLVWIPVLEIEDNQPGADDRGGVIELDDDDDDDRIGRRRKKVTQDQIDEILEARSSVSSKIDVSIQRYYIAHVDGPNWRQCDWNRSETDRLTYSQSWTPPIKWPRKKEGTKKHKASDHYSYQREALANPDDYVTDAQITELESHFEMPFYESPDGDSQHSSGLFDGRHGQQLNHYLPYTIELWTALSSVLARLEFGRRQLSTIVGSAHGIDAVAKLAQGNGAIALLSAGAPEEPKRRSKR